MSTELMVTGNTWLAMKEQCTALSRSGFLPDSVKTPEQAIAIALKGHEIGMPMMQAFSSIHIIKGKPTISAEGMNALIRKNCPKAKLEILINDTTICTIKATRPGEAPFTYTYSIDDAKRAGITGNPSWSKYPDAMLFARCISVIGRRIFPDCLQGISYTPEELGAEVDEDGEVINIVSLDSKTTESAKPTAVLYDPSRNEHKQILRDIAAKFDITEIAALKELSAHCAGLDIESLTFVIQQYLKNAGVLQAEIIEE